MASKSSVFTVVVAGKSTLSKVTDSEANGVGRSAKRIADHFNHMTSSIGHSLEKVGGAFEKMDVLGAGALTGLGKGLDHFAVKSVSTKDIVKNAMKQAGLAIMSAAGAVAAYSVNAAESYASANEALKASVEGSGQNWEKVKGQVESVQGSYHKYGLSSAQVNSVLAQSIISTGSFGASMKHLPIALDLAAAKHIDLNSAMLAVDKAASGNSRVLKQLGIDIAVPQSSAVKLEAAQNKVTAAQANLHAVISNYPNAAEAGAKGHTLYMKAVDKVKGAEKKLADQHGASKAILKTLGDRLGGQASAQADTYGGKLKATKAQATDLGKGLGEKLQPAIEKVQEEFSKFIDYAKKHTWVWKLLAALAGVLVAGALISMATPVFSLIGALGGLFASLVTATAGFMGFDLAAMVAAGGMSALTAAFVATGIGAVILVIIGLLVLMVTHWHTVWNVIKTVWGWIYAYIKFNVDLIWGIIDNVLIKPLMWVWDKIKKPVAAAFSWIGNAITTPFKLAMSAIEHLWNSTIGGFTFTLPGFLGGGTFTIPVLGASGPSGSNFTPSTIKTVGPGVGGAVGFGGVIGAPTGNQAHVTINVHGGDPNQVVAALVAHTRTNGPIPVRTSLPSATSFTNS